eukprot:9183240-Lingulodinium_polyedra.AAC.1
MEGAELCLRGCRPGLPRAGGLLRSPGAVRERLPGCRRGGTPHRVHREGRRRSQDPGEHDLRLAPQPQGDRPVGRG